MRYWAMSLATAICGAFIAIVRFAFTPPTAVWIAFGVAIAATVFSLAAFVVALLRENLAFSGLSALCATVAGWTIIAMRVFSAPTALWLAFAGGLVLLLLALQALALHEATIERVVHGLGRESAQPGSRATVTPVRPAASMADGTVRRPTITTAMRSWTYWLAHTGLALAGGFVTLITFAFTVPGHHPASVRWITFGIGIAASCVALLSLLERGLAREVELSDGRLSGRLAAIALTGANAAVGVAMIVTMIVLTGNSARWVAFALGCGMAGLSLLASVVHELTSERVRHELAISESKSVTPAEETSTASAA
jgi:hypothetical protein